MAQEKKQKVKVTQLTKERFVNLYLVEYVESGVKWTVASRRSKEELEVVARTPNADAINILPYGRDENGEVVVFMIREFRYPVNGYVYSVPAGLVENGKDEEQTVRAEVFEEIGGKVLSVSCIDRNAYTTPGLTDEKMSFYEAEVELTGTQHLEGTENISLIPMKISEVEKMLENDELLFDVKGKFALRNFVAKHRIRDISATNDELEKTNAVLEQRNSELERENKALAEKNARLEAELKSLKTGKAVDAGKSVSGSGMGKK